MPRNNIEATIQRQLILWLQQNYPEIKIAASQNENSRHATHLGTDTGEPDLRLLYRVGDTRGLTFLHYLELKKSKGKLHKAQIDWNTDFDANYASYNCTRSVAYGYMQALDQVKEVVANWEYAKKYHRFIIHNTRG